MAPDRREPRHRGRHTRDQPYRHREHGSHIGHDADPYFQADRLHVEGSFALEPSFAVLVVLEGAGQLGELEVHQGSTVVVPHAAGELGLTGDLVAIRCRPPVLSTVEDVSP